MSSPFLITEPTVISFSGGRTSAYMLWRVLQANNGLPDEAIVVFANTGKEDERTLEFIKNCSDHWNVKIHWVEYRKEKPHFEVVSFETASRDGRPFREVIEHYNKLPNPAQRWCSGQLKIRTIHRFVRSLGWDHHETDNNDFIGIRFDEPRRAAKMEKHKIPLFVDKVTKKDIYDFWASQPFDLNLLVHQGEALLGNCDLCFLKSLDKKMNICREMPEKAIWWAQMEQYVTEFNPNHMGTGNLFRKDHPSYKEMGDYSKNQQSLFNDESIACFCGD